MTKLLIKDEAQTVREFRMVLMSDEPVRAALAAWGEMLSAALTGAFEGQPVCYLLNPARIGDFEPAIEDLHMREVLHRQHRELSGFQVHASASVLRQAASSQDFQIAFLLIARTPELADADARAAWTRAFLDDFAKPPALSVPDTTTEFMECTDGKFLFWHNPSARLNAVTDALMTQARAAGWDVVQETGHDK